MWQVWVNIPVAVWLIISPFILDFSDSKVGTWNNIIVGVVVGGLSLWAALRRKEEAG